MVKRNMLNAGEVWGSTPLPAMTTKTIGMAQAGIYVFRITEGIDIYEKPNFKVEVKNVFGMYDNFCEVFTNDFPTIQDARNWLDKAKHNAELEYTRLQEKYRRRVKEYEENND